MINCRLPNLNDTFCKWTLTLSINGFVSSWTTYPTMMIPPMHIHSYPFHYWIEHPSFINTIRSNNSLKQWYISPRDNINLNRYSSWTNIKYKLTNIEKTEGRIDKVDHGLHEFELHSLLNIYFLLRWCVLILNFRVIFIWSSTNIIILPMLRFHKSGSFPIAANRNCNS